jgi:hypothetical protein|tara:strand:- start:419 stop:697 length:279 start_codon:yes stop_codon:yes gene_type:complete
MSKTKTIKVADVRESLNRMLDDVGHLETHPEVFTTTDENGIKFPMTPADFYRMGIFNALESILHDTGNYNGFGYDTEANARFSSTPMKRYYY